MKKDDIRITDFKVNLRKNQKYIYELNYSYTVFLDPEKEYYVDYDYIFEPKSNRRDCLKLKSELLKNRKYQKTSEKIYSTNSDDGFTIEKYELNEMYNYLVVILGGGSDYTMLADLPKEAELGGELEAVQDYLEACIADGSIADYARPQGRIVMRGGYTPAEYTARIRILDGDSPAAAGTQVTYIADGGPQRTATVDGDGFIEIVLADGAHGIRLAGGDEDAYVDNYLGFGLVEDAFRAWPQLSLLRP